MGDVPGLEGAGSILIEAGLLKGGKAKWQSLYAESQILREKW